MSDPNELFMVAVVVEKKSTKDGDIFEAQASIKSCCWPSYTEMNKSRDRACAISYALSEMASMLYHGTIKL